MQIVALSTLLATAATTVALDRAGMFRGSTRPPPPSADAPAAPLPPVGEAPSEPAPALEPPVAARDPGELESARQRAEIQIVRGFSARAGKDRKAARAFFEEALKIAPDQLDARYEAAREAAFARDGAAAFAHLDALLAARHDEAAQELLARVLIEPDFVRIKRDPRWKIVERTIKK